MRSPMRYFFTMGLLAGAASAQVHLPGLPIPAAPLQSLSRPLDQVDSQALAPLDQLRHIINERLIRDHRSSVDTDPNGEPVVRHEILAFSPTEAAMESARILGFAILREQSIDSMNVHLTVFKAPAALSTQKALLALRKADPTGVYEYNHIYTGSGASSGVGAIAAGDPASDAAALSGLRVGLLDTGVDATHPVFRESAVHTWGCGPQVFPAAHGTAVASLLMGHSGAELYAADVYCGAPTGGAVDALVAALGWLVQEKVPVINISLVGPKNALLERVIAALIDKGFLIVAAVGNDGPAAPPLYPASYAGVVGVTAVDSHHRVLIEAARGPQVMFAAVGADLRAAGANHAFAAVRGTSFAAPIVAALLAAQMSSPDPAAAAAAVDALAQSAIDLGPPGRDLTYGYGLVGAESPPRP
jgi:subtilisin family serine protease